MCKLINTEILQFLRREKRAGSVSVTDAKKKLFEINPNVRIWYRWNLKKTGAGLRVKTTDMSTKTGFLKKGKNANCYRDMGGHLSIAIPFFIG